LRHLIGAACGLFMITLVACQPTPPAVTITPPTMTLVGAFVPTRIATETATSTPTSTNTVTPTQTPTETSTLTEIPSSTPTSSQTPSATPSITRTPTATMTSTATDTATITSTPTLLPTSDGITRIQIDEGATPIPVSAGVFTHEGEIDDETPRIHFILDGQAGEVIGIQMQVISGDLDPYLLLTNASGEVIIENDDDPLGLGRDSYIRDFELPATGRYFVIATRLDQNDGDSEGEFALTIEHEGGAAVVATAEATSEAVGDETTLVCDQTVSKTLDDAHYTWRFSFSADEGQVIGIQMVATSGDLDSIVRLLNEDGDLLEENDDDELGLGKDAFLRDVEIPASGTYLIEASRFQDDLGTTHGDFELTLVCGPSNT
jgi:hypothetical protein